MRDGPCPAHDDVMDGIGYIRGKVDAIAERLDRMPHYPPPSAPSQPTIMIEHNQSSQQQPAAKPAEESPALRQLLYAISALIIAAATLLGSLHMAGGAAPAQTHVEQPAKTGK